MNQSAEKYKEKINEMKKESQDKED